jgi:hypothetical protein
MFLEKLPSAQKSAVIIVLLGTVLATTDQKTKLH